MKLEKPKTYQQLYVEKFDIGEFFIFLDTYRFLFKIRRHRRAPYVRGRIRIPNVTGMGLIIP
jgi:hypothetical protein